MGIRTSHLKNFLSAIIAICIGFFIAFLLLEIILRFLPVNQPFNSRTPVTVDSPVRTFKRNGDFTFSRGWDFAVSNQLKTNNYGFVNDQQYTPNDSRPLLAIVGDSYVEAAMVPYPQTIHGRLANEFPKKFRVYSFGASGAPLSQYLAYAEYARELFQPAAYTFVIIGNDFDESMSAYKKDPGFHYFFPTTDGYELRLVPYKPKHATALHALASKLGLGNLALTRYIRTNLPQLEFQITQLLSGEKQQYVGQTSASTTKHRLDHSKMAVDLFLDRVGKACGVDINNISFIIDGIRPELYTSGAIDSVRDSHWTIMRNYFMKQAQARGFAVVDMNPLFLEDFQKTNLRFEFPTDAHWNGEGHRVAKEALLTTDMIKRLISPKQFERQ